MAPSNDHSFRFHVLGTYKARIKGNEDAVTISVLAGTGGHMIYAGTLTMSVPEWDAFAEALEQSLGDRVEIEQEKVPDPDALSPR